MLITFLAGGIFQDIPTIVGQAYVLSFSASGGTWDGADDNDFGLVTFGSIVNQRFSTYNGDIQDAYRMGWSTFSYEMIATTNPTRLTFFSAAGQCIQVCYFTYNSRFTIFFII